MSYHGCKCEPECFTFADHVGSGPYVSGAATPTRTKEVADTIAREKRMVPDMEAYKRLRREGHQPKTVMGSAALEQDARDPLEIKRGKVFGEKLGVVKEATALVEAAGKGQL